jgi:hypothetical protein
VDGKAKGIKQPPDASKAAKTSISPTSGRHEAARKAIARHALKCA